jgi:hypothetical protein
MPGRSMEAITKADLRRLAEIAQADREGLFRRKPETGRLYSRRLFAVALCQGAALHYLDGKNGIKDFDVWSFYRANPQRPYPARRVGKADFGSPKFGTTNGSPQYAGRKVDLIGRSLSAKSFRDPVAVLQAYLRGRGTQSAKCLSEKAMVLIYPPELLGRIVWPIAP